MTTDDRVWIMAFLKDYVKLCRKHKRFIFVDVDCNDFQGIQLRELNDEQELFGELQEIDVVFEMIAEDLKGVIDG